LIVQSDTDIPNVQLFLLHCRYCPFLCYFPPIYFKVNFRQFLVLYIHRIFLVYTFVTLLPSLLNTFVQCLSMIGLLTFKLKIYSLNIFDFVDGKRFSGLQSFQNTGIHVSFSEVGLVWFKSLTNEINFREIVCFVS
jgi:hypothetical protein